MKCLFRQTGESLQNTKEEEDDSTEDVEDEGFDEQNSGLTDLDYPTLGSLTDTNDLSLNSWFIVALTSPDNSPSEIAKFILV